MGRHQVLPRVAVVLAALLMVAASCSSNSSSSSSPPGTGTTGAAGARLTPQIGTLPPDALDIMTRDNYSTARWTARVVNMNTGQDVLSLGADDLMVMGSNMKLYTIGTALDVLGADDQITTPVHQVGGNLILVAEGDPVMGGRNATPDGPLGYSLPPQFDANGLPGAKPAPGNPLAGLDDLAGQVAAAGVTTVPGDVLIDTRLFEDWTPTHSTVSPIVINDNLLGVITTPGAVGQAPTFKTFPETAAFTLVNDVKTVAAGDGTDIEFEPGPGNQLIVTGTVEAGSDPVLNVYHVPDPATYARTLFIEALQRAGVTVTANPNSLDDQSKLPPESAYTNDNLLGSIQSPKFRAIAELVLKISHNEVANLTVCLMAVELGLQELHGRLQADPRAHREARHHPAGNVVRRRCRWWRRVDDRWRHHQVDRLDRPAALRRRASRRCCRAWERTGRSACSARTARRRARSRRRRGPRRRSTRATADC